MTELDRLFTHKIPVSESVLRGSDLYGVLVADAASNAIQDDKETIGNASYFEPVSRFVEPPFEILIKHDELLHQSLRRGTITIDELTSKLREHGVESIGEVRAARMESDGMLSEFTSDPQGPTHSPPANSHGPPGR